MRRSGSSSCMLRPRNSTDSLDSAAFGEQLSVTMISREELPSFSTERFFMLSEFHLNAHSLRFVADLNDSDEVTPETVDTNSSSGGANLEEFHNDTDSFAPYLIFYVLWRPDMTRDVNALTSEVLLPAVRNIQSVVDISLSGEEKKRTRSDLPSSPSFGRLPISEAEPDSPARELDSVTGSSFCSAENGKTRLYLVVDRTVPFRDEGGAEVVARSASRESQFEGETKLAEKLAKHVASHSHLRSIFQGITIGIANHKRAAPGLDACLGVINHGARDRRRIGRDVKSHVGLIAMAPDDLLGLDEEGETDAAQNVLQTRINTEWNGKGNLKSFGYRAHTMWRKDLGLPPQSPEFPLTENGKRRTSGRRLGRLDEELESFPLDLFLNVGAFLLIAYYVWQGLINGAQS